MSGLEPMPGEVEHLLQKHGFDCQRRQGGKEYAFPCPQGCDDDHRPGEEFHCSINTETGLMHCFKCDFKGNFYKFKKELMGETIIMNDTKSTGDEPKQAAKKGRPATKITTVIDNARKALDEEHKQYYLSRGITEDSITKYQLGFYTDNLGGQWYTIPVYRNGECIDLKLRNTLEGQSPKYKHYSAGSEVAVYGQDDLTASPSDSVLICGGEFDKIIADQMNFGMPVITSTGGEPTFKEEWINNLLTGRRNVYICFDNDETGKKSMETLADKIINLCPETSVFTIMLPDELGEHGDITDANLKGYTAKQLLEFAKFAGGAKPIDVSQFKEMGVDDIANVLNLTIKHDHDTKAIVFLGMLTAYTEEDQLNLSFNGRSSSGKTYITLEVSKLFPQVDVKTYGKTTPTSFYYGDNQDVANTDEGGHRVVDLSRKILIFMDQLDSQLQANLRPLLSHDDKKIQFRLTNKNSHGQNAAENGYLLGFPATVFCSANMLMDEQEQTRCILLSPDINSEKVDASLNLIAEKNADHDKYSAEVLADPNRRLLKDRILFIKSLKVGYIDIPKDLHLKDRFLEVTKENEELRPRFSREFNMLSSLVKAMAVLNAPFRARHDDTIVANEKDMEEALKLWRPLQESQKYGIPRQLWDFYNDVIVAAFQDKKGEPVTIKELNAFYYKRHQECLPGDLLRKNYLPRLEMCGLITMEKGYNGGDKRNFYITPAVLRSIQNEDHITPASEDGGRISFDVDKQEKDGITATNPVAEQPNPTPNNEAPASSQEGPSGTTTPPTPAATNAANDRYETIQEIMGDVTEINENDIPF